jgi:hypothetical protein
MTQKQHDKHHAEKFAVVKLVSELTPAEPTPDGLGEWQGGRTELKSATFGLRARPQRTGSAKNTPGTDYPSKITQRHQKDFNEIHTDANGDFWLYNISTDKWDIKGDSADIPYFENDNGDLLGYNIRTGKWNVPVEEQEYV